MLVFGPEPTLVGRCPIGSVLLVIIVTRNHFPQNDFLDSLHEFSEKFAVWRYLTLKCHGNIYFDNCQIHCLDDFLDFRSEVSTKALKKNLESSLFG